MKKTINVTVATIATILGLAGGWIGFSSYFVSVSDVKAEHTIINLKHNSARQKLEIEVAGALKDYQKQQQNFGQEQQKQLWNYQQRVRAAQLQSDVRHYEFQVQYYKNLLRKNPGDAIAAADLQLAQQTLAQVKAALRKLEQKIR